MFIAEVVSRSFDTFVAYYPLPTLAFVLAMLVTPIIYFLDDLKQLKLTTDATPSAGVKVRSLSSSNFDNFLADPIKTTN